MNGELVTEHGTASDWLITNRWQTSPLPTNDVMFGHPWPFSSLTKFSWRTRMPTPLILFMASSSSRYFSLVGQTFLSARFQLADRILVDRTDFVINQAGCQPKPQSIVLRDICFDSSRFCWPDAHLPDQKKSEKGNYFLAWVGRFCNMRSLEIISFESRGTNHGSAHRPSPIAHRN